MKKNFLAIICFLAAFFLSGCAVWPFGRSGAPAPSWQEEVLWATDCGQENLACCSAPAAACSFGLSCCANPADSQETMCRDSCQCGTEGAFCCPGEEPCQAGLACQDGKCRICGLEDGPCCLSGPVCDDELYCFRGQCQTCGQPGHPCCPSGEACQGSNERGTARAECREGVCVFCGSDNKIACQNEPFCNLGHLLNNNFCYRCGGYNQPCCAVSGQECDFANGLACVLGFCTK